MNVDEEILRENANSERRYILTRAREEIAAVYCSEEYDNYSRDEFEEGYGEAKSRVLAIIDKLLNELNV